MISGEIISSREAVARFTHRCHVCDTEVERGRRIVLIKTSLEEILAHPECCDVEGIPYEPFWDKLTATRYLARFGEHTFELMRDPGPRDPVLRPWWAIRDEIVFIGSSRTLAGAEELVRKEIVEKSLQGLVSKRSELYIDETFGPGRVARPDPDRIRLARSFIMAKAKEDTKASKKTTKDKGTTKAPAAADRNSMSDEERAAAVRGELQIRSTKGDKKQDALGATDESGRPAGRPLGVTTGLPILGAWCYVFQENEKRSKKWTDAQISEWMKKEFPGRNTPAFDHPHTCRRDYNLGKFTRGATPKTQSKRYDEKGNVLEVLRGRPSNGKTAKEANKEAKSSKASDPDLAPSKGKKSGKKLVMA